MTRIDTDSYQILGKKYGLPFQGQKYGLPSQKCGMSTFLPVFFSSVFPTFTDFLQCFEK